MLSIVSPSEFLSNGVIRTGDECCRMCPRCVSLRRHGECSQPNSPQQLEHRHAEEHRLEGKKHRNRKYRVTVRKGDLNSGRRKQTPANHPKWNQGVVLGVFAYILKLKLLRIHPVVSHWALPTWAEHTTFSKQTLKVLEKEKIYHIRESRIISN